MHTTSTVTCVYAHRARRNLFALELTLLTATAVDLIFTNQFDPLHDKGHGPGSGCAGDFTVDFTFLNATNNSMHFLLFDGQTNIKGDYGEVFLLSVATSIVPSILHLTPQSPRAIFFTVLATSIEFPGNAASIADVESRAMQIFADASSQFSAALFAEHVESWAELYDSGIDITPDDTATPINRGVDIALHANSSLYYLYSSIRDDWSPGVSPGGASTQNYQGAVFMDMDWWMEPSLTLMAPTLARSLLEYRFLSINASQHIAQVFGYKGAMFAWTAAMVGRAFGCCDGRGGYEDCLEQHVTGDVAFSAWQYYHATHNITWLVNRGWPLLASVARFAISRVTPSPRLGVVANYSITGILPVDEWCVGSGCGCETPGVSNDAQMNGVTKASLVAAARVAALLNMTSDETQLWEQVGDNIVMLFNSTAEYHLQFTSPTCPGGSGGSHYQPSHTVCPEDVLLLTYPLGNILNVSDGVVRADAERFIPVTCKENAGMTTPIHTIVWLQLGEVELAEAEFNRSMHAACYGPYLVRNEVDKHVDIIGGHFDNTHFLTGDGGYLQALVFGYGGIRIVPEGLLVHRPILPDGVRAWHLRRLRWQEITLDLSLTKNLLTIEATQRFCWQDGKGTKTCYQSFCQVVVDMCFFPGLLSSIEN